MKYPLAKFSNLPIIIGTKMITWILHPPVRPFPVRTGMKKSGRSDLLKTNKKEQMKRTFINFKHFLKKIMFKNFSVRTEWLHTFSIL